MALIKLNFCPGGVSSFTDSAGNQINADANGQCLINPDQFVMADLYGAGFTVAVDTAGATSGRPTAAAPGLMYFDATLGKPVWLKTAPSTWVDATGTAA